MTASLAADPKAPLLSIIIPAYNVAPYIRDAMAAALDQEFTDLEVVVVDDGSTDTTPAVIRAFDQERDDRRLRVVTRPNGGLSAARNTGIEHARGEFLGFLDSDDIWLPEKAGLHLEAMLADPGIGITFSQSEYITEDGSRTGLILAPGRKVPSLHDLIRRNHVGNGSSPVVRRDCFAAAGRFREELRSCEDYEMWCRILAKTSYRAVLIPEPLTLYRLRETSLCFNFEKFLDNADRAMAFLRQDMPNVPDRVFRAGHAEHYRIAAWKAASTGQDVAARKLLRRALGIWPQLAMTDWRAWGTAAALWFPAPLRGHLTRIRKLLSRSGRRRPAQTTV